jgi:hypothetical protein
MAERQLDERLRSENDPSYYRHCLGVSGFGDSEDLQHEVESLRTKLATMDSPEELLALISDAANNDVRLRLRTKMRRRIRLSPVRVTAAK